MNRESKADVLVEGWLRQIRGGEWRTGTQLPTERHLAETHQVSRGTVRQALKQLETLGFVHALQGSGTFVREPEAQTPRTPCRTVTLLLPDGPEDREQLLRAPFYSELLAGITDGLQTVRARVSLLRYDRADVLAACRSARDTDALFGQGILLAHARLPAEDVRLVRGLGLPVVAVGRPLGDEPVSYVEIDHADAMRQCMRHLLDQGHRRIALLNSYPQTWHARVRLETYRTALRQAGLPCDDLLVTAQTPVLSEDLATFIALCRDRRPTAAILAQEGVLPPLLNGFRDIGIRLPDDLALLAYRDEPLCRVTTPALTSVDQASYRQGCEAAALLLDSIGQEAHLIRERLLPVHLIPRASTALPCPLSPLTIHA